MVTKIEKEIGDMIEKNVDFDSIVHSSPNILRNPVNIRTNVIHALEEIGLVVQDNPNGSFRRFVRLICSDKNGTYYMFCKVVRLYKEPDNYLVFASSESCKTSFVCYEDGTAYFLNDWQSCYPASEDAISEFDNWVTIDWKESPVIFNGLPRVLSDL